ncbi:Androgen-induced gene 1 protein [Frankliniella fusca]|uniref:Androgen-induced gene 1 protein n=1 Tax=Frankliniella fusca TaxID=407009 RepID=A0AAE1L9X8_9NEOP|nr:Androgen-induced gene 1 protein [Frankliniella fusca]
MAPSPSPSRSHSVMTLICAIIHLVGAVQFTFAVFYDYTRVIIPKEVQEMGGSGFGGKFVFLTFWDAILQAVYFTIALGNDAVGDHSPNPSNPPLIRRIKDFIFASFAFPIAMFVAITFWSIMAIDRELVLPKKLDDYFPLWLNHIMHTNIAIFILLEMFLSCRKYPSKKSGLIGLTVFMAIYLSWTFVIYFNTNHWVYPVMEHMDWPFRIAFLLAMLAFCLILYLVGDFINSKRWGELLNLKKDKPEIPNPDETLPMTDADIKERSI